MRKTNMLVALAVSAACLASAAYAGAGDTTLSGKMYVDLTNVNTQSGGKDVDPNGFGLDVKRFYISVDHTFDDTWSSDFTTDFNFPKLSVTGTDSTGAPVSSSGNAPETQVFVKKAYVQGKFSKAATLRLGSADMPWIPFAEGVYGYRFLENTLIDRLGFGNSADWGAHLLGSNDSGALSYQLSVVNGGGYKNPSRSKGMDEEGRVTFQPADGLILALGAFSGKRGLDTEAVSTQHTASRTDALVAWKAAGLTAGIEYFAADNYTTVLSPSSDKADGYSVFASYDIPETDYSVFARYDNAKPSKDLNSSLEDKYYNAGFAWKSNKNITWAVAYKSDKLSDNAAIDKKFDEFGIWAQVAF